MHYKIFIFTQIKWVYSAGVIIYIYERELCILYAEVMSIKGKDALKE